MYSRENALNTFNVSLPAALCDVQESHGEENRMLYTRSVMMGTTRNLSLNGWFFWVLRLHWKNNCNSALNDQYHQGL
jgi:hypothetical protein